MITLGKAPRGAVAPLSMELDGLFKLDVDDDIWQDIGLTDDNDDGLLIPEWLGNDNIRKGIKSLLELDRCVEEERRLIEETISMQQWMREEWVIVVNALLWSSSDDPDLVYQLVEQKKHLLRLCLNWIPAVRIIPKDLEESWGPTLEELEEARQFEVSESLLENNINDEENEVELGIYETDEDDYIEDAELVDNLENIGLEFDM
ncbi:hypothetical protein GALMADRAFT_75928 [Galerina marginata CBS 339.88]|uniref:Uncharacterized protein n=1 Tax=Galerina marginata (strain CBS 339.88) TaxID=685588 RepID=A0A067SV27_GALM3|nr:hypothetical protein GALMADRAFT_75928 [Galerina marginata CBS 339.88]